MSTPSFPDALQALRSNAVVALRPEWGRLRLTGGDRLAFMHNMTTQDIKRLSPGEGAPAAMINQRGALLDHLSVHALPDALWLITGPGRAEADLAWLDRYLITEDVQLTNETDATRLIFVSGRLASEIVEVFAPGAGTLAPYGALEVDWHGHAIRLLGAEPFQSHGYHLLVPAAAETEVLAALAAEQTCLLDAETAEYFRVAAGLPLAGHEIVEERNPWEARLDQAISLHKGCYLGQEIVARLNTYNKVQRYLIGLNLAPGTAAAVGDALLADGKPVGALTSVASLPGAEAIALGYVRGANAAADTPLVLRHGDVEHPVTVADRPFWHGKTRAVGDISHA